MQTMGAIDWTPIQRKYPGKWVAFADDEVTVAGVGDTLHEALVNAKKKGHNDPILARMPLEDITYVGYGV